MRADLATFPQVLVDVGAGNGYFSLAAAARGHDVIAFELSNASLASFEASTAYNGFQKAITLHKVAFLVLCILDVMPPGCHAEGILLPHSSSHKSIMPIDGHLLGQDSQP